MTMEGFFVVMFPLLSLIFVFSYWISWEVQHKQRRPPFTTKLRNDAARLFGRGLDRIRRSGTKSIAPQSEQGRAHARNVSGK
jgi:hypothetical protein